MEPLWRQSKLLLLLLPGAPTAAPHGDESTHSGDDGPKHLCKSKSGPCRIIFMCLRGRRCPRAERAVSTMTCILNPGFEFHFTNGNQLLFLLYTEKGFGIWNSKQTTRRISRNKSCALLCFLSARSFTRDERESARSSNKRPLSIGGPINLYYDVISALRRLSGCIMHHPQGVRRHACSSA